MNVRKRSPDKLMAKAEGFCAAARLLLEAGHIDDAATRAYYAMFDAARAALLASGAPVDLNNVRTHKGLISAFGEHLVKNGLVSKELNRFFIDALEVRLEADYDDDHVGFEDVKDIVEQAEIFVSTMRKQFMLNSNDDNNGGTGH